MRLEKRESGGGINYYIRHNNKMIAALGKVSKTQAQRLLKRSREALAEARAEARIANRYGLQELIDISVHEYIAKYMQAELPLKAKKTQEIENAAIARFMRVFDCRWMQEITGGDMQKYFTGLLKDFSPNTVLFDYKVIRHIFNRAIDDNHIRKNPVKSIKLTQERKPPVILTPDQISALLDASNPLLQRVIILGLYTGMRIGEILDLRVEDIDIAQQVIRVTHYKGHNTKGKKTRYIPINQIIEQVKEWMEKPITARGIEFKRTIHPYLFCWPDGKKYNRLHGALRTACKKANVTCGFHDLRKTCASYLVRQGVSLYVVQELLGHANITTTQKYYAELSQDNLRNAMCKIDYLPQIHNVSAK